MSVTAEEVESEGTGVFAEVDQNGIPTGEGFFFNGDNAQDVADAINEIFEVTGSFKHFNTWEDLDRYMD